MKTFYVTEVRDYSDKKRKYGKVIDHKREYRPIESLAKWFERTKSNHCIMYKRYSNAMSNAIIVEDLRIDELARKTSKATADLKWLEEDNGNFVCITRTNKKCKLYYMYLDEGFVVFE